MHYSRKFSRRGWMGVCAAVLFATLFSCVIAHALDSTDIVNLKRNGIPEEVIGNMVRQSEGIVLDAEDEEELREAGVSDALLAVIRATPTVAAPAAAAPVYETTQSASTAPRHYDATGQPVSPVPVYEEEALPARYAKEGWLTVSNTDVESYYLAIDVGSKRMFLSTVPNGGIELPSGTSRSVNLRKETYKLYGDSGRDLKVRVRENEVTRLSLIPYGVVGNSGLTGVATDRDRTRSESLFDNYVPPPAVIVEPAPVIVVPEPYPYYHPYRHRPRGWGFGYGFGW